MADHLHAAMAEATRLTRAGRLADATAMIQRTLGGSATCAPAGAPGGPGAGGPEDAGPLSARALQTPPTARPAAGRRHRSGHAPVGSRVWAPRLSPGRLAPPDAPPPDEALAHVAPADTRSRLAGRTTVCSFTGAAGTRTYRLYAPGGHDGEALPLLVMLHGGTQTAIDFAVGTRMDDLADREGFLIAYPEQPPSANPQRCWNWFRPGDQRRNTGEPSLLAGIVAQIREDHRVADGRVFVAGLSAGGAMAAVMAATYPDVFAAAGVHSGLAFGAARDLPSAFAAMNGGAGGAPLPARIPLIAVHGGADRTVHPANLDALVAQATGGRHDAAVEQGRSRGGRRYTRTRYAARDGHPAVERWLIHQAGHAWSGGDARGSYVDPQGPDASAAMIRFFTEVARRPGY